MDKYLNTIYNKYYRHVLKRCLEYTRDVHSAKDMTQDIFIKIFKNINNQNFIDERNENKWLLTLTKNYIIDDLRKKKVVLVDLDYDLMVSDDQNTYDYDILNKVIELLPKQQKNIIKLYYFEGLNHKKISLKCNTSISTSKTNLLKAKKNLKKYLLNYEKN